MKTIHQQLNDVLEPEQWLVTILLLGLAAVAIWAACWVKDPSTRTAITLWMIWP